MRVLSAPANITLAILACTLLAGCSSTGNWFGSSAAPDLRSTVSVNSLSFAGESATLPTRVFAPSKVGVADIYMTDIPEQFLKDGGDLSAATGVIVHVHCFLRPRAGKTPIDPDATTAIARVFVLTGNGQAGLYAGGGFFLTSDEPKDENFSGSLRGATLYLSRATTGFDDLLGPSRLEGGISGARDEAMAARLALVTQALAEAMDAVE